MRIDITARGLPYGFPLFDTYYGFAAITLFRTPLLAGMAMCQMITRRRADAAVSF